MADVTEVLQALGDAIVEDAKRANGPGPDAKKSLGTIVNAYRKLLWQSKSKPGGTLPDFSRMNKKEREAYRQAYEAYLEEYGDGTLADLFMEETHPGE